MKIPNELFTVLQTVAPTLATAIGGPLAGAAASVAARALSEYLGGKPTDKVTADNIIEVLDKNKGDPSLIAKLREIEADLKKYETDYQFRFAELEIKDRQSARTFQQESGIAADVFGFGRKVFYAGSIALILFGVLLLLLSFGVFSIPYENREFTSIAFNTLSVILTAFITWGGMVLSYYFGSSRESATKTATISEQLVAQGEATAEAIRRTPAPVPVVVPPVTPPPVVVAPAPVNPAPAPAPDPGPMPPEPSPDAVPWQQGPYGGARWKVLPSGVLVEGDSGVARSVGEPVTIRRIWNDYGELIKRNAEKYSVPAEIITMTIATESKGQRSAYLTEPDGRTSVGLMQILIGTASEVMNRSITFNDLNDPELNIEAGTRYILKQKPKTWFDPILTAAAYNAGGLYPPRQQDNNRFNLRSTGDHLERAIRWYGDICFVAKQDGWFK